MKLDTRLNTKLKESSTLVIARIYGPDELSRVYDSFERALEWAQYKTNQHDAIMLAEHTACAAHTEDKPEKCKWRIEPLVIYS